MRSCSSLCVQVRGFSSTAWRGATRLQGQPVVKALLPRSARRGPSRPGSSGGRTRRWPTGPAQVGRPCRPTKYLATSASHLHVAAADEIPLCAHKQNGDKARRLRSPFMATDKYEAFAWERPRCAACFNLAPASFLTLTTRRPMKTLSPLH